MLLAIDIGNSNVVIGLHDEKKWVHTWRLSTLLNENPLAYYQEAISNIFLEARIHPNTIKKLIISSVVPELKKPFSILAQQLFSCPHLLIGPDIYPQLPILVPRPNQLGTDLYANALAAYTLYHTDCIIVDFGTALTFTVINQKGEIKGVNIAPGLKTAIHALFLQTAQLPEVPLSFPESAIGNNTTEAIQNGIMLGYVGLVKHMIEAIRKELGAQYQVIATGGLAYTMTPLHSEFNYMEPDLTLEGLRICGQLLNVM